MLEKDKKIIIHQQQIFNSLAANIGITSIKTSRNHFFYKCQLSEIWQKLNDQIKNLKIQNFNSNSKRKLPINPMIMNDFMSQVEIHMIQLRKKNMNLINQFKIQMFQTRKNIEKNIIKMQFGISDSQLMTDKQTNQNLSIFQKNTRNINIDKDLSTNYDSRAMQSKVNQNFQISRFTNDFNKQNQNPNRRVNTDISVIEQFPVKHTEYSNEEMYNQLNLNALKNDESMQLNTQDVKKKYQKFISPSAGWTVSAQPIRQKLQNKHHRQITPFSTQFGHQEDSFNQQNNHSFRKDFDLLGFKEIDERHFSRTNTIQELECEENNESQNY